MAFGIGTNSSGTDAGSVRGTQKRIGCQCWFTSTGKVMPLMLKLQEYRQSVKLQCIPRKKRGMQDFPR